MRTAEHPLQPEELMEYLDGELPPERASAVQEHVAACALCQKLKGELGGVSRDLATWTIDAAPMALRADDIASPAPVKPAWRPAWLPAWLPAWGMYSVAAVGAAAVLLFAIVPARMGRDVASYSDAVTAPTLLGSNSMSRARANTANAQRAAEPTASVATSATVPAIEGGGPPQGQTSSGPRILRTATLHLVVKDLEAARTAIDRVVAATGGFLGEMNMSGVRPDPRTLRATLRIPSDRLDSALTSVRVIGQVTAESRGADDVTEQVLDLEARIANGRNTEKRLSDLLQKRTGDLADVLAAEREVARVREEIERLDAQRKNLDRRVTFATVTLQIDEEHKSTLSLGPLPLSARFRNACVDGFRGAFEMTMEVLLIALLIGPAVACLFLVGWPIYLFVRRRQLNAAR